MKVIHALEPLQKSVMLIGPTPRTPKPGQTPTPSWRPGAIQMFEEAGYDGILLIPEAADWAAHDNYDAQIEWELEAINQASIIMCWLPRDLDTMPGFTTNVEFGKVLNSGKLLLGFPGGAPKMSYLEHLAHRHKVPVYRSLEWMVKDTIGMANKRHNGTLRSTN